MSDDQPPIAKPSAEGAQDAPPNGEERDVEERDVEARDVEARDVEARDVEEHDVEARDVEERDVGEHDTQKRDTQKRDTQKRDASELQNAARLRVVDAPEDAEDYLWDGSGEPDELVAELEGLLKPLRYDRNLPSQEAVEASAPPPRQLPRNTFWLAAAALLLLAVGWTLVRKPTPVALRGEVAQRSGALIEQLAQKQPKLDDGWLVQVTGGAPSCDGSPLSTGSRLRIGAWMETDSSASARLTVADIGVIEVMSGSRLRILTSHATQHRVELTRGSIHASVKAPARTFVVDTPLASVIDLGCSYSITLDDDKLAVDVWSGAVTLESPRNSARKERAFVPASASCRASTSAIGTPYFQSARSELTDALTRHDLGEPDALDAALSAAQASDELTLWHLYDRAGDQARARIAARITALDIPLPPGVTSTSLRHNKIAAAKWWAPLFGRIPTEATPKSPAPEPTPAPSPPRPDPEPAPPQPSAAPAPGPPVWSPPPQPPQEPPPAEPSPRAPTPRAPSPRAPAPTEPSPRAPAPTEPSPREPPPTRWTP